MNVEYVFAPGSPDGSDGLLGMVIRDIRGQSPVGVNFVTTRDCPQQVGFIKYPKGYVIQPHVHQRVTRVITSVPETLLVARGRFHVLFYTESREFVVGKVLEAGDVVVLLAGGHGFECMDDCEIYEVRQGPYLMDNDKIRFEDLQRLPPPCPTTVPMIQDKFSGPSAGCTPASTDTNENTCEDTSSSPGGVPLNSVLPFSKN